MKHNEAPHFKPAYEARITEEETKLRWLISRHPESRELAYYLIFLLTANQRYVKALAACRQVLDVHPDDVVANMWRRLIHVKWREILRARVLPRQLNRYHRRHCASRRVR